MICAREKGEETALSVFSERAKLFEFNIATRVQTIITDEGKLRQHFSDYQEH